MVFGIHYSKERSGPAFGGELDVSLRRAGYIEADEMGKWRILQRLPEREFGVGKHGLITLDDRLNGMMVREIRLNNQPSSSIGFRERQSVLESMIGVFSGPEIRHVQAGIRVEDGHQPCARP